MGQKIKKRNKQTNNNAAPLSTLSFSLKYTQWFAVQCIVYCLFTRLGRRPMRRDAITAWKVRQEFPDTAAAAAASCRCRAGSCAAAAAAATAAGVALNTAKRDEATRRDAITTRCRVENGAQVLPRLTLSRVASVASVACAACECCVKLTLPAQARH